MRGSTTFGTVEVDWFDHASLKFKDSDGLVVYVDPWSEVMSGELEKADVIISTHDHFDHFDKKMIQELKKKGTVVVCTEDSEDEVPEDLESKVIKPGRSVKAKGLRIRGVYAYNVDKFREPDTPFHPKGFCTGVIFELDGLKFYHASDTDPIPEMEDLSGEKIDVAFMPVGGHYTMDQEEAIEAINMVNPAKVVPIHYGFVDQTSADVEKFREDVEDSTGSEPVIMED
ncbi:MAG: MBL fold metallo-hydrolase [Candidatus Nanohaloarchaea archaeon]